MKAIRENAAPSETPREGNDVANRKLGKGFMAYTTDRRLERLKRAASILEAAGVNLDATGQTGLINDFAENLEDYLRARLKKAGKSKEFIEVVLKELPK